MPRMPRMRRRRRGERQAERRGLRAPEAERNRARALQHIERLGDRGRRAEIDHAREPLIDRVGDRQAELAWDRLARHRDRLGLIARGLELEPWLRPLAEQLAHEPAERRGRQHHAGPCRDRFDRLDQLGGGLEPLIGILREQPHHQRVDLGRDIGAARRRRRRGLGDDRVHVLEVGRTLVQPLGGQHLPEADPEREQVATPIDALAATLLGRQVADLALHRPGLGLVRAIRRLRHAEVDDLDAALVADHEVRGRHVAMHDAERTAVETEPIVRVVQPRRRARRDGQHGMDRQRAAQALGAVEQRPHGLAVHVLHREEIRVAELPDVVDLRDVRVLELGREARLIEEHADEVRVRRAIPQDPLEHTVALDSCDAFTARQEDLRHATRRELGEDLVAVGGRPDLGGNPRHVPIVGRKPTECQTTPPGWTRRCANQAEWASPGDQVGYRPRCNKPSTGGTGHAGTFVTAAAPGAFDDQDPHVRRCRAARLHRRGLHRPLRAPVSYRVLVEPRTARLREALQLTRSAARAITGTCRGRRTPGRS